MCDESREEADILPYQQTWKEMVRPWSTRLSPYSHVASRTAAAAGVEPKLPSLEAR